MPQVFNALNGNEQIEVILDLIRKKLEATGEFKGHLTFPWTKVAFAVSVTAYPQQAMDAEKPLIKVVGEETFQTPDAKEEGKPKVVVVTGGAIVDSPDKARVEANIPVPTIVPGPGGQLVDRPVTRIPVPVKKGA